MKPPIESTEEIHEAFWRQCWSRTADVWLMLAVFAISGTGIHYLITTAIGWLACTLDNICH